jgi:hypothetical protein
VPILLMLDANRAVEETQTLCAHTAYELYGSSSSPRLDLAKYDSETRKCLDAFVQNFVTPTRMLSVMFGLREREIGLFAWGVILVPLALLWVIGWVVGWVAAGFRN